MLPITSVIDLNVVISLICEKRVINESDVNLVLGMDGGQQKIIVTLTVCPLNENKKVERKKEPEIKNRYMSFSTHRVITNCWTNMIYLRL